MMHGLGKVGFTQSYTYFTWRTTAGEMREYCEELVASADHMRPNFWPNTPGHPARDAAERRPADVQDPGGTGQHCCPRPGACTPATSCSSTWPGRAPRSTSTTRSTSCARATGRRAERGRRVAGARSSTQLNADPAGQPGPALAAQPALPRHRQRRDAVLVETGRDDRQHGAGDLHVRLRATCQWANTTLDMPALGLRLARAVRGARRADRGRRSTGASTTRSGSTRTASRPTSSPCTASGALTMTIEQLISGERPRPARTARCAPDGDDTRPDPAPRAPRRSRCSSDGERYPMNRVHDDGVFEATVPGTVTRLPRWRSTGARSTTRTGTCRPSASWTCT